MNVKNIKSFIEFYESLGVSTFITPYSRNSREINEKVKCLFKTEDDFEDTKDFNNKSYQLELLKKQITESNCNLKDIATNLVFSEGNYDSKIMLIGEAPGAEEDRIGKPFVGQAGKLLDEMLQLISLNRNKNVYLTNIIFWRPPGNRTPNSEEVKICLPFVQKHIDIIDPELIIVLGNVASKALLNKTDGITKLRTQVHFYINKKNAKIPLKAIFHPAYLLRNPSEKKKTWDDLKSIYDYVLNRNLL